MMRDWTRIDELLELKSQTKLTRADVSMETKTAKNFVRVESRREPQETE